MDADTDFPDDLVDLERDRQTLLQQLKAIPPRPWTDTAGIEHRTDQGWVPEHDQEVAQLRARLTEASLALSTHEYWQTFSGPDRVAAKSRLKQAVKASLADDQGT
ncbi:hypothetical protein E1265_35720 [Streptomyces sp. 8K308]|uniref:hypothetical protein n=1 Tax=Streptomyces sp. 8K308 TaxID=2530388 RepID=UPI001044FA5A|nr:hypothetical protein [Streptomyces sp. 8K308]TDC04916.1 hypothetical protein E1265_35720 [Streptomyces sp. 8K308]